MNRDNTVGLSNHRLEKARDLSLQAELLLKDGRFDGCVNRSYYAIFNAIRSLLALHGLDSRKHGGVIAHFDRHFVKTGIFSRDFSKIVHAAFDVRQASDYEDFYVIPAEQAKKQFEDCRTFIAEVEKVLKAVQDNEIALPVITEE